MNPDPNGNWVLYEDFLDAPAPAEARGLLDEALRAGLQAAKACPLNTTYHERVMNEARAFLASNPALPPKRHEASSEAPAFPMQTEDKALDVHSVEDAKTKVSDIKVVGNGDTFALLCKASSKSQGWMKSAKAMEVPGGCVVQVTTQHGSNVAEALTFVPGVKIAPDVNDGRKLVAI